MSSGSARVGVDLSRGRGARRTSTALGGEVGGAERVPLSTPRPNRLAESVGYRRFPPTRSARRVLDGNRPPASPPPYPAAVHGPGEAPGQRARRRHRQRHRAARAPPRPPSPPVARGAEPVAHPLAQLRRELARSAGVSQRQRTTSAASRRHGAAQSLRAAAPELVAVPAPARARRRPSRRRPPRPAARASGTRRARRTPRALQPSPSAARAPSRTRQRRLDAHPLLRVHDLLGRGRRARALREVHERPAAAGALAQRGDELPAPPV